jgi:HlyD family secretion protein
MAGKSNPTKRILVIGGILLALIVVVVVAGKIFGGEKTGIEVETTSVTRRDLTQVVTASGKIQPEIEVKISPDVSGEIVFLGVKEGDWVEKGTLLARIKSDFYATQVERSEAGVSQAKAALAQTQAQLMGAETEFNRQKDLLAQNAIPRNSFETAQTQFKVAQANVQSAQFSVQSAEASVREAREQLNKTSIFAPMSGVITQLNIELGERVLGTNQMTGTEMMRISRLDQMEVQVDVNENDVVNVAVGDTAAVKVDAYPDRVFKGVVTEIANSARVAALGTQDQVTNFPVKVRLLGQAPIKQDAILQTHQTKADELSIQVNQQEFRPGMSGTVDMYAETVRNAISIPMQAVTARDFVKLGKSTHGKVVKQDANKDGDTKKEEDLRKVVFVMKDGKAKMVEVETGISNETHIEIKSGLTGSETVIVGPFNVVSRDLNEGDLVQLKKEEPVTTKKN